MLDFFEVKEIVEVWTSDEDWDTKEHEDSESFYKMIEMFEKKGFENLDTDFIHEILVEKLRDKYHNFAEDEVMEEAFRHTEAIEEIVYSEMEEEDFDE